MYRTIAALALLAPSVSLAACPSSPDALSTHAAAAEKAFAALDSAAFTAAMTEMEADLGCLESVVPPGIAAEVHKAHGLASFLSRDLQGATASFRSAAAIDHSLSLDPGYAPKGGPLAGAWENAEMAGPSLRDDLPTELWVDGQRTMDRPRDTPHIVQTENGDTYQGVWLTGGQALPEWATKPTEVAGDDPVGHGAGKGNSGSLSATTLQLASASGAAILLSGGLFAAALAQEGKFKRDDSLSYADRVDMQKRTNNLGFAAQGIGVVGLGLGATAVISTRW